MRTLSAPLFDACPQLVGASFAEANLERTDWSARTSAARTSRGANLERTAIEHALFDVGGARHRGSSRGARHTGDRAADIHGPYPISHEPEPDLPEALAFFHDGKLAVSIAIRWAAFALAVALVAALLTLFA